MSDDQLIEIAGTDYRKLLVLARILIGDGIKERRAFTDFARNLANNTLADLELGMDIVKAKKPTEQP